MSGSAEEYALTPMARRSPRASLTIATEATPATTCAYPGCPRAPDGPNVSCCAAHKDYGNPDVPTIEGRGALGASSSGVRRPSVIADKCAKPECPDPPMIDEGGDMNVFCIKHFLEHEKEEADRRSTTSRVTDPRLDEQAEKQLATKVRESVQREESLALGREREAFEERMAAELAEQKAQFSTELAELRKLVSASKEPGLSSFPRIPTEVAEAEAKEEIEDHRHLLKLEERAIEEGRRVTQQQEQEEFNRTIGSLRRDELSQKEEIREEFAALQQRAQEQERARRRDAMNLEAERDRLVLAREEVERLKFEADGQRRKQERNNAQERRELDDLKAELLNAAGNLKASQASGSGDGGSGGRKPGDDKSSTNGASGGSGETTNTLERILEALAASQAENQRVISEMQKQGMGQQTLLLESMLADREMQREKASEDALAAAEMRQANLEMQQQQLKSQEEAQRMMLRIGNASSENRGEIKTEVSNVTSKDAVTLFFVVIFTSGGSAALSPPQKPNPPKHDE